MATTAIIFSVEPVPDADNKLAALVHYLLVNTLTGECLPLVHSVAPNVNPLDPFSVVKVKVITAFMAAYPNVTVMFWDGVALI